jgi:hypothetical protein
MKTIKFDLKLKNGEITLRTLDDLEENLSPELFTHFHTGKLAKWLRVRKLDELAEKMEALRAQNIEDKNELDVKLFKNLCEIFVSEVSEEEAREAMQNYQPATLQNSNDEEIESLKAEIESLRNENDELRKKVNLSKDTFEDTNEDTNTKLIWGHEVHVGLTWYEAANKCHDGWRLPTLDELKTLRCNVFDKLFSTKGGYFWSNSCDVEGKSWAMLFEEPYYICNYSKNKRLNVRLVRG